MPKRAWIVGMVLLLLALPGFARAQSFGGATGNPTFDQSVFGQAARATQHPHGKAPTETLKEVKKKFQDVDPRVRVAALDQLETVNNAKANALLMQAMTDPDLRVKIKAIDILGAHQFNGAVPMMSQELFLRDTPKVMKLHLVAALGRIGDSRGMLPIMQYLDESKDSQSRGTAVFALGEIGDPKATGELTKIIATDKSEMVRRLAQEALAKIDGELPSVHSQELADRRAKENETTYERMAKVRKMDEKLQQQNW